MNRDERERMVVFSRVKLGQLSRREAALALSLSLRQVHRMYGRYVAYGAAGLVHRGRGRASNARRPEADELRALKLYREHYAGGEGYAGFGPTHFALKLGEEHGIYVSHDTARRWLMGAGLLTEDVRRRRRSRRRRLRKRQRGEMVQMDGSEHDWFEGRGRRCVLMVMVDDATGEKFGRFYEGETLAAALEMMRYWCEGHGVPQSVYVDRAGIYRSDREPTVAEVKSRVKPVTQFGRAMVELGVRLIMARSPQAKGRVERANRTLQDRLVKELRVAGIGDIASANAWLEGSGFFAKLNEEQCVQALDEVDGHRPVVVKLEEVLCVKESRVVGADGCVQWHGQVLQLRQQKGRVWPRSVVVHAEAGSGEARSLHSGGLMWGYEALSERPKRVAKGVLRGGPGPARKPTAGMRRQISALFAKPSKLKKGS